MAVGARFGYFSASLGSVRLGGSGVMGHGSCSLAPVLVKLLVGPVVVICVLGGFGGLGGFDGCGYGFAALGRGVCPFECALVSSGPRFARLLLDGVRRVVQ